MKFLLCIPTIILWGLNPILTRLCSDIIGIRPYMMVTSIISAIATVIVNTLLDRQVWRTVKTELFLYHDDITKRWLIIFADSIFCLSIPMVLYNIMLSNSQSIAIVVTSTWYGAPLITCVISVFVFAQRMSPIQIVGIIVCLAGIVMMNIEDIIDEYKKRSYTHL